MLTHRKLLQSKAIAVENDLRGTLRNFGLKVGIGKLKFEARIKELVESHPDLAVSSNRCSLSDECCANRPPSCTAVCWPSCGTMRCAGG